MAQKKGFTARMDNSDDEQRKYDMSCNVIVSDDTVTEIRDLTVTKNGQQVGHATFNRMNQQQPNISVNVFELPLADHAECISAVYAFASQAAQDAVE